MVNYNHLLHHEISDDILQTISDRELPLLRDLFKNNYPYAVQAFRFIDLMIDWKNKNPNIGVRITCPNGEWKDGTFVGIVTECTYNLFFFTLEKNHERLCRALRETKILEWSRGPYICALHEKHHEKVMKILQTNGIIDFINESTTWILRKEVAMDFDIKCPNDVYISPLTTKHVPIINSLWPHSFPGSEHFLTNLINMNYSFGIFTKTNNQLVSWIMVNDFGAHGTLQTIQEFKRRGYAALLVQILAKKLAENGMDSISNIVRKNLVSQNLFRTVGFEKLNDICWVQLKEIVPKNNIVSKL